MNIVTFKAIHLCLRGSCSLRILNGHNIHETVLYANAQMNIVVIRAAIHLCLRGSIVTWSPVYFERAVELKLIVKCQFCLTRIRMSVQIRKRARSMTPMKT